MRNVVSLSDIPVELHEWLRKEAASQSRLTGKRICIYNVVAQAIEEYKARIDNPFRKSRITTPTVELFRKKIQPSELTRRCICVPKEQQFYFGKVGNTITMRDAIDGSPCLVPVNSQYRLDISDWYRRNTNVKPGDEIIFKQKDGYISINPPIR